MKYFNWAESFKETPTCEDILSKVQKTEMAYWIWLILSVCFALIGVAIVLMAPKSDLKLHCIGVILAIEGIVNIALIKIWVQIRLSMFRIIWDRNNKIESEINKLEAQDL